MVFCFIPPEDHQWKKAKLEEVRRELDNELEMLKLCANIPSVVRYFGACLQDMCSPYVVWSVSHHTLAGDGLCLVYAPGGWCDRVFMA